MSLGEVREGGQIDLGLQEHRPDLGELPSEHVGDGVELGADGLGGRLGEDRADGRGHYLRGVLGITAKTLRRK